MSPEAQRIAIAKACGFSDIRLRNRLEIGEYFDQLWECLVWRDRDECGSGGPTWGRKIPDYLDDLNAIHDAEMILSPEQSTRYAEFILDILEIPTPFIGTARCAFLTGHAIATQRAEAFLKTLNLWDDTQ